MITVKTLKDTIEDMRNVHKFEDDAQILIADDLINNTRMGYVHVIFYEGDVEVKLSKKLKHTDPWDVREVP